MVQGFHKGIWMCAVLVLSVWLGGCTFTHRMVVNVSAPLIDDMNASFNRNSDLQLVKDSMPVTLCSLSGLVDISPKNKRLLNNASQAYFAYSFAFVEDDDQNRARNLYLTARDYALRAMFRESPKEILALPVDEFEAKVKRLGNRDASAMFWATVSWFSYICLSMGDVSVYLDIPKAEILTAKLMDVDPSFYFAGPHLLTACFNSAQSEMAGGDLTTAKKHFDTAIDLSQGKFLMHHLYYAKFYAVGKQDKALFLKLLKTILDAPADILPDYRIITSICKLKADKLLSSADDYF